MYVVLDTNILYYWSGIQKSDFDSNKINSELKAYEVIIPLWTAIEILTSSDLSSQQKKEVFILIYSKNLPIHGLTSELANLIPPNIIELFDLPIINTIIEECLKFKKEVEVSLLLFLIESSVATLGIFYDKKISTSPVIQHRFTLQLQSLILGNREHIEREIQDLVETFYVDLDEAGLKEALEDLALSLLYIVSLNFNSSLFGKFTAELKAETGLTDSELSEISDSLSNDKYFKRIQRKMNKTKKAEIIDLKGDTNALDNAIEAYIVEMSKVYGSSMVKYLSTLIKKIFTDGTKITKNDMIDSQLFLFDPNYLILSAEKRIRNIYRLINKDNAGLCDNFVNRIKLHGV